MSDANGKPMGIKNLFMTPDWMVREMTERGHDWAAEARVQELKNSIAFADFANLDDRPLRKGETIQVRRPKRYR